jgi:Putative DNA-binding domain
MLTFAKAIEEICESDLQGLVSAGIPESRIVEFKAELPGRTSNDHKEFLRDVVVFSNSLGGHIIYGIEGKNGVAANLCGLGVPNIDEEILRLEQMIRSGIEPIIHGLKVQPIPLPTHGNNAVVIEIPAGLFGPHMIRNRRAFTARTSSGKMDMDFGEIRAAFVGAETAIAKLNEFRQNRTGRLIAGESIVPLIGGPAMLTIHLLPLQSFTPAFQCDLTRLSDKSADRDLVIARNAMWGWQPRFTHHGFVQACTGGQTTGASTIYANVFRNGAIEVVDCDVPESDKLVAIRVEFALLQTVANLLRAFEAT